ncbi:MAG: intradiol ring-cleavage dioxygenase [Azospirillaceae bacterium]|nr:intradiol ring-cleavage dioxygenase [Azospirillaceae bacterium]
MPDKSPADRPVSRRRALAGLASASGLVLTATPAGAAQNTAAQQTARVTVPTGTLCRVTPQSIEGPYYIDPKLVRADIREGRPGVPLTLDFIVLNGADCTPLAGARVDVWHADAGGVYSGYDHQGADDKTDTKGQTFLRGTQMTDAAGQATFRTIWPGWYAGRTTHIHFKVFLDQKDGAPKNVLMGQMYFPDALSEFIYTTVRPYCDRPGMRDMVNATDPIAASDDADHACYCAVKEEKGGYVASLALGVDRNGRTKEGFGPGGPGGPGPMAGGPPPSGFEPPKGPDGKPLPPPNGQFGPPPGAPPPGGPMGGPPPGLGPVGPRILVPGVALANQQGKAKA